MFQNAIINNTSKNSLPNHAPTWIGFKTNLALFCAGFGGQVAAKTMIKYIFTYIIKMIDFVLFFYRFWVGLKAKDPCKNRQNHLGKFSRGALWRGLGASWDQDGPRCSFRFLPILIFICFEAQLNGLCTPTWWILETTLVAFGTDALEGTVAGMAFVFFLLLVKLIITYTCACTYTCCLPITACPAITARPPPPARPRAYNFKQIYLKLKNYTILWYHMLKKHIYI